MWPKGDAGGQRGLRHVLAETIPIEPTAHNSVFQMQCVSDTWCVRLRVSVPQSQVESQSALLQMQLSSGIGCVGCQTIPRARSSDHRRQILVCESLRARIRSPLCATCACGGYHRRSRRDAGHPPVRVSACHTCFEAAKNTYIAKVLHNIEEVVCLLAPVSHSINGFTEDQIFRDFGPHVLLLWLYLSVNVSGVFVLVRAGSYLKVATAAAINLNIKLLKLCRPSTFPDPRRG